MAAIAALYLSLMVAHTAESGNSSLTNFELLIPYENRVKNKTAYEEMFSAMQEKQVLLEATVRSLTESLIQAQTNAETSRREAVDLALKLETLGISSMDKSQPGSDHKLLAAMWALRDLKKQADEFRLEIERLTKAITALIKTADQVDPMVRFTLETELRKTKELLEGVNNKETSAICESITNALVLEVKNDLSLVIANVGTKHGVQIGMTFKILRMQKYIGTVRVIDVRTRICGTVIQNLSSIKNPIKPGDSLRVETNLK